MKIFKIKNRNFHNLIDFILSYINSHSDKPIILALTGQLGSGKTTFTQYLGKSLGIRENIVSPTFIMHREYKFKDGDFLHHIDLYRLHEVIEFKELKIEDMLKGKNIIIIEWADRFKDEINSPHNKTEAIIIWINFEHNSENSRIIKVEL